jgi:cell division septation protein DedD
MIERTIDRDIRGGRDERQPPAYLKLVVPVLVMAAFGGALWYGYGLVAVGKGDGSVPLIAADTAPTRKRPDNPGGLTVPHQDVLIYERLQRAVRPNVEERLLPQPEAPLPKPVAPPVSAEMASGALPTALPAEVPVAAAEPAAVATPPALPVAAAPAAQALAHGFRVQIASVRGEEQAAADWRRLSNLHSDLLGGLRMTINQVDLGPEKGTFHRLQAGDFAERGLAERLCLDLKARGLSCLIVRY